MTMEKNIVDFLTSIDNTIQEAKKEVVPAEDVVTVRGKEVGADTFDKISGKKSQSNGSHGLFAVDEPTDDDLLENIDDILLSKNKKKLVVAIDAEMPFFIQGKAGWGKTSIIKKIAKKYGYTILTVYLDKAMKEDLGGIPVPVKNSLGHSYQEMVMPGWANYILERPEKKFLLFFDEMNQADPGVMNALMPIVQEKVICGIKFDNMIVGAAGNLQVENRDGVNELSGPLKSRFKPVIVWETNTPQAWMDAFKHLHRYWDSVFGEVFISAFEEREEMFANPREIEQKVFEFVDKLVKKKSGKYLDEEDIRDRLLELVDEDTELPDAKVQSYAEDLAEMVVEYIQNEGKLSERRKRSYRASDSVAGLDEDTVNAIKKALIDGVNSTGDYITLDNFGKYTWNGVTLTSQQVETAKTALSRFAKYKDDTGTTSTSSKPKKNRTYVFTPTTKKELKDYITREVRMNEQCDLNDIDVSGISDFSSLFENTNFNGDVSDWDMSKATTTKAMFKNTLFDGDISGWELGRVEDMSEMFLNSLYTGVKYSIADWNVSSCQLMSGMFKNSRFNGDISKWNIRNVVDMTGMFVKSAMKHNLSAWSSKLSSHVDTDDIFFGSPLEGEEEKMFKK